MANQESNCNVCETATRSYSLLTRKMSFVKVHKIQYDLKEGSLEDGICSMLVLRLQWKKEPGMYFTSRFDPRYKKTS